MPDTIYALSSAPGRAAVAILRVSGDASKRAVTALSGRPPPAPRLAQLRELTAQVDGEPIDEALVLWFPGPNSYTGENMAEFHVHGGRAVIAAVIGEFAQIPGLRPAEPGEFTRRAFEAGRLDLTAAEGIADLINAETEAQRKLALRQADGVLGRLFESWRAEIIAAQAYLEAAIDFSDEPIPDTVVAESKHKMQRLQKQIAQYLDDQSRGERLRQGLYVTIIGPPNAGKSSLLNELAGRDAAIVSDRAGTTRDVIEVQMDIEGWPVTLADTAGLRESADDIEREGVTRALRRAEAADFKIALFDGAIWPDLDPMTQAQIDDNTLAVLNKADLLTDATDDEKDECYRVSCTTGAGLDAMIGVLCDRLRARYDPGGAPVLTRERHRRALVDCQEALVRYVAVDEPELAAEDLRTAARALGRITGRVDVEEVLGAVFSEFCIGK